MNQISYLEKKILEARDAYYNSDTPLMSDKAFDSIVDELKKIDPNNKSITMIGAPLRHSEWQKAKHKIPMGSLDKINRPDELIQWTNKICPDENLFVCEKLDGLSIEIIYENGALIQAITRGTDGIIGEDITSNVTNMNGVFKELYNFEKGHPVNFTGSLRGEIIMTKSKHKKFFSDKANPRNAASGVSKRLDGVGSDHLDILFYQVLRDEEFETEYDQFQWLTIHHLQTPNFWLFKTSDEVNTHWREYQDTKRHNLDYDIDGLVVRINNLTIQSSLGDKDLRPKGAIAFKFDSETRETILLKVDWQVGSSGRITPVAILKPVIVSGAEITRASLHNIKYFESLKLFEECRVLVSRRNDVIPYVEENIDFNA